MGCNSVGHNSILDFSELCALVAGDLGSLLVLVLDGAVVLAPSSNLALLFVSVVDMAVLLGWQRQRKGARVLSR